MKMTDTVRRAGRSLRQAKTRTLLTSLAIAVGAFTITLSIAAAEGARQYADKLISSNVDPQALFIVKDEAIVGGAQPQAGLRPYDPDDVHQGGVTIKQLNEKDLQYLKQRDDLTDVRPLYQPNITYLTINGFDEKYSSDVEVYNPDLLSEVTAGSLPELGQDITGTDVVVPAGFADTLKVSEKSLIGRKVTIVSERAAKVPSQAELQRLLATEGISGVEKLQQTETTKITLTIRAVVKQSQVSFTSSSALQIPIARAAELAEFATKGTARYQKYLGVTAKVKEGTTPENAKQALEAKGYYPQTAKDLQGFLFTIINVLLGIVAGFGVIALLASVFGIINTQYISVLERTSQIGLMKALGMRGRDVSRLFRYEAAWIGFLGGLIGVVLAWAVGTALNPWITETLELGEGTRLLVFQPLPAVGLIIGLMIIAIIAGYFPSRKAAKLDPIEALRTE